MGDNSKGKEVIFLLFVLLLILFIVVALGGYYYFVYRTQKIIHTTLNNQPLISTNSAAPISSLSASYPGSYKTEVIDINTYYIYYRGEVLNVIIDQRAIYTVTLQPQDEIGNNSGTSVTFTIPKYPPKINSATLGKNFKEMIDKGLSPINIRIKYDQFNKFMEWESLK